MVSYETLNSSDLLTQAPCIVTLGYNGSEALVNSSHCGSVVAAGRRPSLDASSVMTIIIYGLICVAGLIGNFLVIFVISRYTKMKTVTNSYILNLSVADLLFLLSLPLTMTTTILRHWVFGHVMCKVYWITHCINMFTGALTLTAMSGDRFLAVVFPISSLKYRTSRYAQVVICSIWALSFLFMLPAFLYAKTVPNKQPGKFTCTIAWPDGGFIEPAKAFICYSLILGFVVPVTIISILYTLLIVRLRTSGPTIRSAEKKRSQRRITKLVTLIIVTYIICWLPYWGFQVYLILPREENLLNWQVYVYQFLVTFSYFNSTVNPCLYAGTNTNFRESFGFAFKCQQDPILHGFSRPMSEASNSMLDKKALNGCAGDGESAMITHALDSPEKGGTELKLILESENNKDDVTKSPQ